MVEFHQQAVNMGVRVMQVLIAELSKRRLDMGMLLLLVAWPSNATGAPRSALGRLAELDGTEYIEYRNRLITPVGEKWDVSAATQESWESGLVALVVNARVTIPEKFREWDEMGPILRATGNLNWYRNREYKDPNVVGLFLERIWKPELSPGISSRHREHDIKTARIEAYEALKRHLHFGCDALGPAALWERVWAESDIRELRLVAASALSCGSDEGIPSQVDAIFRGELDVEFKEAALDGVAHFRQGEYVDYAMDLLKDKSVDAEFRKTIPRGFHNLVNDGRLEDLRRIKVMETFEIVASDPDQDSSVRCAAIGMLSIDPHAQHATIILEASQHDSSSDVRLCAVRRAFNLPIKVKRDTLREIIKSSEDSEILEHAVISLSGRCEMEDAEFLAEIARDEHYPERVRETARNRSDTKIKGRRSFRTEK